MARLGMCVTVNVKVRWWLYLYLYILAFMCALAGREPDLRKVEYWIVKGMKVWIAPTREP